MGQAIVHQALADHLESTGVESAISSLDTTVRPFRPAGVRSRLETDPLFLPVSSPKHGSFGVAASGSRRGRLGRPRGSAETAEQRRQPCRTVCIG
jgi:hypothetical protein